ncbi:nuclear transport factor 2 family protein [Aeromicrobium sp.]|uniref:nuclear transport factor 2 family protein n=1 Tax=Aeromicrobium sp. TaxID=1871063 RepID=UPI0019C17EF8|nr:nuclear transport factor 2 family protein [Aeromicrobium sp.]MBC7632288.1 nuclear transport factor 2 family protein [Aeromicrobium sp.]
MDGEDVKATLLELERRGWDSLCDCTGGNFYGGLMTADAVMVLANGAVMDRAAVVESLAHAPPWRTYSIDDALLICSGPGTAALVYRGTAYRETDEPAFTGVMSSVYQDSVDGWRLVLYQQTPIPPTD